MIDLIDVLPEKDRTVEYLKSKIKMKSLVKEDLNNTCEEIEKSNVFKVVTSTSGHSKIIPCIGCGKTGHIKRYYYTVNSFRGVSTHPGNRGRTYNYRGSQGNVSNNISSFNTTVYSVSVVEGRGRKRVK